MSKETVEYQVNNKTIPKNTAILTERDIAINSKDCWGYAIRTRKILDIDDTELIVTDLIACCGNDPFTSCSDDPPTNIWISGFLAGEEGRADAYHALSSLLEAIDAGERVWDVIDHNPNL